MDVCNEGRSYVRVSMQLSLLQMVVVVALGGLAGHADGSTTGAPVVIIGAGLAGAKVAYELAKSNVPFVILEGTEIVGGRIRRHKVTPSGPYIEMGANWVQGYHRGDPFSDLVTDVIKLNFCRTKFLDAYFVRDGKIVPDEEADPSWARVKGAIDKVYGLLNHSRNDAGEIVIDMSVKSALIAAAGWESDDPVEKAAMRHEIDYEYATPASEVSIQELTDFYDPGRPPRLDMFVNDPRGFRAVVEWHLQQAGIQDSSRDGAKLVLNATVKYVRYGEHGAFVMMEDGRWMSASAVVSTVPVGVLQHSLLYKPTGANHLVFDPPLPADKRLAIAKFDLADYTKMFIKFRHAVFTSDQPTFLIPVECNEGSFINLHNLNTPGYFPGENMVLLTATDILSRDLTCVSDSPLERKALDFVSLAAGRPVYWFEVEQLYIPRWHTNPYSRGAFTTRVPGISRQDYQAFNRPLGALFFAGESHSPEYHGYVQGAWTSGAKTAADVIAFLQAQAQAQAPTG